MENTSKRFIKYLAIAISSVCLFVLCFAMTACNEISSIFKNEPVETVEMGDTLPSLKAPYFGLGELYKDDKAIDVDAQWIENAGLEGDVKAVYTAGDNQGSITVLSSDAKGQTLQQIADKLSYKGTGGDARISNSEMYLNDRYRVDDVFYVMYSNKVKDSFKEGMINQICVFLDGSNTTTVFINYFCSPFTIADTDVMINLPNNFLTKKWTSSSISGYNNKEFKCIFYDHLTELPSVMYSYEDKNYGDSEEENKQLLKEETEKLAKEFGSPEVKFVELNGLQSYKFQLDNFTDTSTGKSYNANVYQFISDGKLVTLAVYEQTTALTHALTAFEHAIYKAE